MTRLETNQTAEEKRKIVNEERKKEIERLIKLNDRRDNAQEENKEYEIENDEDYREPLSIEKEEVYKILLSWGGPSDGFKLYFKDGELLRGVYFIADWGTYEESELTDEEAELVYDFYMYGDVEGFNLK